MTQTQALFALLFGAAGLLAGRTHFLLLGRSVLAMTQARAGVVPLGAPLLRVVVTGATLTLAAKHGEPALLAAFAGFLAARALALRAILSPRP
jgi:N-ATPase, AtpR subunit